MKDAISTKQGFFSGNLNLPQYKDNSEANKKAKAQQVVKKHEIAHKLSSGPLRYESWIDYDSKCKAALISVHGLGLNSSSYEEFGCKS